MTPFGYISSGAANQDATNAPGSSNLEVNLEGFTIENTHATLLRYVKFYKKQNPTSADTPFWRFCLAPNGGGVSKAFSSPARFPAGLSFRITTGAADNDANAAGANDVLVNLELF